MTDKFSWKHWCWLALAATGAALLLGGRQWLALRFWSSPVPWWSPFVQWLLCLWFWVVCSPLVMSLAARFRLDRGKWARNGAMLAACGVGLGALAIVGDDLVTPLLHFPVLSKLTFFERLRAYAVGVWHTEFITYAIMVALAHAGGYYQESREKERNAARLQLETARLEADLNQAQLQALRMQLNPHFLFNALNTVAVLIGQDPRTAYDVLVGLSDLLRASLKTTQGHEIPLAKELTFLEQYLAIEKLRFQDRLTVEVTADPSALDALVPIFLLQPLVENAIRHAVAARTGPCTVAVRTARRGACVELHVIDDGPGLNGRAREGVGLSNTRERLSRLYPGQHSFELGDTPGRGVTVRVVIPYHNGAIQNDARQ